VSSGAETQETIPLFLRRRFIGSLFGGHASIRRGRGSDIAGSRPYQPGDHFHSIDWKSSARLSSLTGSDEFIVRERFSEELPHVVLICDRRPEMALFPPGLPWLHKPAAVERVVELLARSAINQRGLVGYLDYASHGEDGATGAAFWRPPRAQASAWQGDVVELIRSHLEGAYDAPVDNVGTALTFLSVVGGSVPTGSIVFVVSDFLARPSSEAWAGAMNRGWDVVAVIVQDPVWEQSFPPLAGVLAPILDVRGDRLLQVRLSERQAAERRAAHESRLRDLRQELVATGADVVLVSAADRSEVRREFLAWAEQRLGLRGDLR
jgi:hypothetical protein